MKKNKKKKSKFKRKNVSNSFTGTKLTSYAGLSPIMQFINKLDLGVKINNLFPTIMHNTTKFTNVQIFLSIILASLASINRIKRIVNFTCDPLIISLLNLKKGFNKDVISQRLKKLGQRGAFLFHEFILSENKKTIKKINPDSITLDVDSTEKTVYGNQEGASKGFNPHKKGAKSYHPLLAFFSELKLLLNSWFRCGDAYTSNGIVEFIKQTKLLIPETTRVFFRADSGFFNGSLFDLLDVYCWTYLVKVKLRNLSKLLNSQSWQPVLWNPSIAICEFDYQCKDWSKKRRLRAIKIILVPEYEYFCYCSNLEVNAIILHELYKERATSETWIEQLKSQLLAGSTTTNDFHANDILWQLSVYAYNLSVLMRYKIKRFWREEHSTFRDWFILIPAKVLIGSRTVKMKIYEKYYFKNRWKKLEYVLVS